MGFFHKVIHLTISTLIRLQGLCKENKLLMKYLVTYFFLTDVKTVVSLGSAAFVFNIPLPKGKPLLKDKRKTSFSSMLG